MRKWKIITMVLVLIFSLSLVSGACSPEPQSLDEFFAKNVVKTINPGSPTGSTAFGNRVFASYWPDVTGGHMIVKNAQEGGGLVGVNQIYNAEPDGLTVGIFLGWDFDLFGPYVAQSAGMEFELDKLNWWGALASTGNILLVSPKLEGVETAADLKKIKDIRIGAGEADGAPAVWSALLIRWLGLEGGKVVTGYGTGELGLALAKGEIDASVYTSTTAMDFVENGFAKAIAYMSIQPGPDFPDLPTFIDQAELTSGSMAEVEAMVPLGSGMRVFIAPPEMSPERLEWLRSTFIKITDDEGFRAQYGRRWPIFNRLTGGELDAFVKNAVTQPTDRMAFLQNEARQYMAAQ